MFILLALLSTFGFTLQYALMTKFARKWDALSIAVYRSLSLWISLLPLLFFSNLENISQIYLYQFELILSSFSIVLNVWAMFESYKYLPIWIASWIRSMWTVLTTIIISLFLFNEKLSSIIIISVIIMLIGWFILSAFRNNFSHLDNSRYLKWLLLVMFSWLLSSIWLIIMVKISRELDPYVSSYFWELEAGLIWIFVLYLRKIICWKTIEKISLNDFWKILAASSPTIIWTACFALASLYWPVWIISAIWVFGILLNSIIGTIFFKEHLRKIQYVWIVLIMIWVVWIKLLM